MKKLLIVLLVLALILAGLFFYKGGHHAIVVSDALEEFWDEDHADQSLTLLYAKPGVYIDNQSNQFKPKVDQWTMTADSFWTEYGDDRVYGLTAEGVTAYLREDILYMDTGRAYALSVPESLEESLSRLAAGVLLYGRVTKNGDTYRLSMETEELELSASVILDRTVQSVTVSMILPDDSAIYVQLNPKAALSHPIPQAVADAMVLAEMERPTKLTEPLSVLLSALENLLPLSGTLELGIASGVLELSETVELTVADGTAAIVRGGIQVEVSLPDSFDLLSPAAAALLVLRSGEFDTEGNVTTVTLSLPGDATAELTGSLIPQASELDIRYGESTLTLTITAGALTQASITASGDVPFLFTAIPLDFTAKLTVP